MAAKNRNKKHQKSTKGGRQDVEKAAKRKPTSSSSLLYVLSALVLFFAISIRYVSKRKEQTNDKLHTFLTSFVCNDEYGYCHNALVPFGRSQQALKYIVPGTTVLVVPRKLQIWDLDALRSDFIQSIGNARHASTRNPLDSGAFLAAHLAKRLDNVLQNNTTTLDPMRDYLQILPSFENLAFHPVLWTEQELQERLGKHSSAFAIANGYRDMVLSEYQALTFVSTEFAKSITLKQYRTMRTHVMSRSFGPGPPGNEEQIDAMAFEEELAFYNNHFGINLTLGCRAMVPILDMYNHHAKPNVEWRYSSDQRAFVIYSNGIASGDEIMDSYGKYTDAHLFAKFGFVNGDGSGYTQASIAVSHQLLDLGMKQQFSRLAFTSVEPPTREQAQLLNRQKRDMIRYLQFDDGYDECIRPADKEAFELKRLKLLHLQKIANHPDCWILHVPPSDPNSKPAAKSNIPVATAQPPKFDYGNLKLDARKLISTCRLIALTNQDFNGNALSVLQDALANGTEFKVDRLTDALEFRALSCLARLSGMALSRFGRTVQQETSLISNYKFQTTEWTTAHVRLGEMQTLELLQGLSLSGMKQFGPDLSKSNQLPAVRSKPCPWEYSKPLM